MTSRGRRTPNYGSVHSHSDSVYGLHKLNIAPQRTRFTALLGSTCTPADPVYDPLGPDLHPIGPGLRPFRARLGPQRSRLSAFSGWTWTPADPVYSPFGLRSHRSRLSLQPFRAWFAPQQVGLQHFRARFVASQIWFTVIPSSVYSRPVINLGSPNIWCTGATLHNNHPMTRVKSSDRIRVED